MMSPIGFLQVLTRHGSGGGSKIGTMLGIALEINI